MRVRFLAGILLVAMTGLFCGDNNNQVTPPGPTELEGVWTGYSESDTPPYPRLTYTFANNTIVVTRDTCSNKDLPPCVFEFYRGTFTVDTVSVPKKIDISITTSAVPSYVNKTLQGIYRKSMNNIYLSANEPGTERPVSANPPMVGTPAINLGQ